MKNRRAQLEHGLISNRIKMKISTFCNFALNSVSRFEEGNNFKTSLSIGVYTVQGLRISKGKGLYNNSVLTFFFPVTLLFLI